MSELRQIPADIAAALAGKRVAFALTGSFCTLERVIAVMAQLRQAGALILPILSQQVRETDSRFGSAAHWRRQVEQAAGNATIIDSIAAAEPLGPQRLADILVIAPCTGNSLARLTLGLTDTPVLMAAKAHLRCDRPLVVAVSTNDGLSNSAKNIGALLNTRHIYFVPFGQDDPQAKPDSLVAQMELIPATLAAALGGEQLQPLLLRT